MSTDFRAGFQATLVLPFLVACASDPVRSPSPSQTDDAWTACGTDLDCVADVLATKLVSDPAQAVSIIERAPSPEAQWVLVKGAIRSNPQRGSVLCDALGDTSLQEGCRLDTMRPHLYSNPPTQRTNPGLRTAPGPHTSTLVLRLTSRSIFADTPPSASGCPTGPTFDSCVSDVASRLARDGQARSAAAACMTLSAREKWRGECAFRAAEAVASRRTPSEAGNAIELCLLSDEWVGRCIDKVHEDLSLLAPPANAGTAAWQPALAAWEAMSHTWSRQGDAIAEIVEDAWWSHLVTYSYRRVRRPTGDPLDALPPHAHPHIRAAAAWLYMLQNATEPPTMAAELAALRAVLALRTDDPSSGVQTDPHSGPQEDLWPFDAGDEGSLAAVHYLGRSRRVLAEDADIDLQISILEAAARRGRSWTALIAEATHATDPLVAATARRLQGKLNPSPHSPGPPR